MSYDYNDALFEAVRLLLDQDLPVDACSVFAVSDRAALLAGMDSNDDRDG